MKTIIANINQADLFKGLFKSSTNHDQGGNNLSVNSGPSGPQASVITASRVNGHRPLTFLKSQFFVLYLHLIEIMYILYK